MSKSQKMKSQDVHERVKNLKGELPPREVVGDWVKKDLKAAISFLHLIDTTPGLLEKVTNEIYEHVQRGQPKID